MVGGRLPEARVLGQDHASSYKAERGQAAKDDSSSRCSQGGAGGSRLRSPAGFSSANSWSRSQREHHTGPDARAAVCRAKGKEGFSHAESSLHVITTVSIMYAEHEACACAHTHTRTHTRLEPVCLERIRLWRSRVLMTTVACCIGQSPRTGDPKPSVPPEGAVRGHWVVCSLDVIASSQCNSSRS